MNNCILYIKFLKQLGKCLLCFFIVNALKKSLDMTFLMRYITLPCANCNHTGIRQVFIYWRHCSKIYDIQTIIL